MKKTVILTVMFLGLQQFTVAQNNVVGLHLQSFAFGEIRGSYERAITDKFSILLNYGYKTKGEIPQFILDPPIPSEYNSGNLGDSFEAINEIGGFQFVPEFRIYLKDNDSPSGLYVSPYLRFSKYSMTYNDKINYDFSNAEYQNLPQEVKDYMTDNNLGQTLGVNTVTTGDIVQKGFGVQLGYQWIISDVLAIDFYFLGLEIDNVDFTAEASSPDATALGIDYTQWENEIEGSIDFTNDIPFIDPDIEIDVQSDKIVGLAKTLAPWYRGGIKIGFAF